MVSKTVCLFYFYFHYLISRSDLEDGEWDKDLPEDIDSLSVEEIEKEINQMIGKN